MIKPEANELPIVKFASEKALLLVNAKDMLKIRFVL